MARRTRIFIASAGEDLEVAHNLAEALGQDFDVTAWDSGVFGLSQYRLESLLKALDEHDVGVVVLSPTDVVSIRGKTELAPRDNVVFELGMMVVAFGRLRSYMVLPQGADTHILTDLLGVELAHYNPNHHNQLAAMATVANKIRRAIRSSVADRGTNQPQQAQYELFTAEIYTKFATAFKSAKSVDLVFIHSRSLLDRITEALEEFLSSESASLRVFLPDLGRQDLVDQLAKRFDDGPLIPGLIAQAYLRFAGMMRMYPHRIAIRLFRCVPCYSCYRFDDLLYVALYPMSQRRRPSPTFHCPIDSPLGQFVAADLEVLRRPTESRSAPRELLMKLSREFGVCV